MAVKFLPTGSLDITTAPTLLPAEVENKNAVSGALRRCTNLRLDETGRARTRFGSTRGSVVISPANLMLESEGHRYEFGGGYIYRDEVEISSGLTNAQWSAVIGKSWNETDKNIYATNGVDRVRIQGDKAYNWGIDAPFSNDSHASKTDYVCTYNWEEAVTSISGSFTQLQRCNSITGWSANNLIPGSETITADTKDFQEATASIRCVWTSAGGHKTFRLTHNYGSEQNWSSYTHFTLFVKYDAIATNPTKAYAYLYLEDSSNNVQKIYLGPLSKDTWHNRAVGASSITLDKTKIQIVGVEVVFDYPPIPGGATVTVKADDICGYSSGGYTVAVCRQFTSTSGEYEYIHAWERQTLFNEDSDVIGQTAYAYLPQWWWELAGTTSNPCWIRYTYVKRDSSNVLISESNPSPPYQLTVGGSTRGISFGIPSDPQVTHIRLYRTNYNAESTDHYYFDSEWPVSISAIGIQIIYDNELSILLEDDHYRPPLGSILAGPNFLGYIFMAKGTRLYYCKANQMEYWPGSYYIDVGSADRDITDLEFWNGQLFAWKIDEVYLISGTGHGSFMPVKMNAKTGVKQHTMASSIKGAGIFHIAPDGVYVFTMTSDDKITSKTVNSLFYDEIVENIAPLDKNYITRAFVLQFRNKVWFFYPAHSDTYCGNIMVIDMDSKKVTHYNYGVEFTAACVDATNNRLYACDSSGYIWQLENISATDDNGTAIDWQIQSKQFADPLYKYFPRWAKYDVDVVNGNANAYILLNETVKQTHGITGSRNTRKRLITHCTGDRLSVRLSGSGVVSFYGAEVE